MCQDRKRRAGKRVHNCQHERTRTHEDTPWTEQLGDGLEVLFLHRRPDVNAIEPHHALASRLQNPQAVALDDLDVGRVICEANSGDAVSFLDRAGLPLRNGCLGMLDHIVQELDTWWVFA